MTFFLFLEGKKTKKAKKTSSSRPPSLSSSSKTNQTQQLRTVFLAYSAYGARRPSGSSSASSGTTIPALPFPSAAAAEIDGARFSKLVRAAGLLESSASSAASGKKNAGSRLTPADVDLAFAQACASSGNPASKKLRFEEFAKALRALAGRGGIDEGELAAAVCASGGPRPSGEATVPEFVRFHDDKVRRKKRREKREREREFLPLFSTSTSAEEKNSKKTKTRKQNSETVDLHGGPRPRRAHQVRWRAGPRGAVRQVPGGRARRELDLCEAALNMIFLFCFFFRKREKKEREKKRENGIFFWF